MSSTLSCRSWFDTPVPALLERTPREALLLGGLLTVIGYEVSDPATIDPGNLFVYVLGAVAFGTRFFAARGLAMALAIAAIAQRWAVLRYGASPLDMAWDAWIPIFGIAVLASRDLVERFDRAPSALGRFFPNHWARLPEQDARRLLWAGYGMAGMLACIHQAWEDAGGLELFDWLSVWEAGWPLLATAALGACLLLLARGWAPVVLASAAVSIAVLVGVVPDVRDAESILSTGLPHDGVASALFLTSPEYALPVVAFALLTLLASAPYVVRLLRRLLVATGRTPDCR